jgi:hypothetical protein
VLYSVDTHDEVGTLVDNQPSLYKDNQKA